MLNRKNVIVVLCLLGMATVGGCRKAKHPSSDSTKDTETATLGGQEFDDSNSDGIPDGYVPVDLDSDGLTDGWVSTDDTGFDSVFVPDSTDDEDSDSTDSDSFDTDTDVIIDECYEISEIDGSGGLSKSIMISSPEQFAQIRPYTCIIGEIFIDPANGCEGIPSESFEECVNSKRIGTIDLPHLQRLEGPLIVRSFPEPGILDGLKSLTTITDDLRLDELGGITNLDGLRALRQVGASVVLQNNPSLENIDALSQLTEVSTDLVIKNNPLLSSLNGLSGLRQVGRSVSIFGNASLANLQGLEEIASIGGDLFISWNTNLQSLQGLPDVSSISGNLTISHNTSLESLAGLMVTSSISGDLDISGNTSLKSLQGLAGITSISGNLTISWNAGLTDLQGLEGLVSISDDLFISHNGSLQNLDGLQNLQSLGGSLKIFGNSQLTTLAAIQHPFQIPSNPKMEVTQNPVLPTCEFCDVLAQFDGKFSTFKVKWERNLIDSCIDNHRITCLDFSDSEPQALACPGDDGAIPPLGAEQGSEQQTAFCIDAEKEQIRCTPSDVSNCASGECSDFNLCSCVSDDECHSGVCVVGICQANPCDGYTEWQPPNFVDIPSPLITAEGGPELNSDLVCCINFDYYAGVTYTIASGQCL